MLNPNAAVFETDSEIIVVLEDAPIHASDISVLGVCAPCTADDGILPMSAHALGTGGTADSKYEPVYFPIREFGLPVRRLRPTLKFTAADLGVPEVKRTIPPGGFNVIDAELLKFEPVGISACEPDCFSEESQVAWLFAQAFGHLGPESTAKTWCEALNFLVSLYPDASSSDKRFVYNLLEDLASQMRTIFPMWVNGTNALECKLVLMLKGFDGLDINSSVSGVRVCGTSTYERPPDSAAASCSILPSQVTPLH
jgi:hypothetical protein